MSKLILIFKTMYMIYRGMKIMKIYRSSDTRRTMTIMLVTYLIIGIIISIIAGGSLPILIFFIGICFIMSLIVLLLSISRKIIITNNKLEVKHFRNSFTVDILDITDLSKGSFRANLTEVKKPVNIPVIKVHSSKQTSPFNLFYSAYKKDDIIEVINYILSINNKVKVSDEIQSFILS